MDGIYYGALAADVRAAKSAVSQPEQPIFEALAVAFEAAGSRGFSSEDATFAANVAQIYANWQAIINPSQAARLLLDGHIAKMNDFLLRITTPVVTQPPDTTNGATESWPGAVNAVINATRWTVAYLGGTGSAVVLGDGTARLRTPNSGNYNDAVLLIREESLKVGELVQLIFTLPSTTIDAQLGFALRALSWVTDSDLPQDGYEFVIHPSAAEIRSRVIVAGTKTVNTIAYTPPANRLQMEMQALDSNIEIRVWDPATSSRPDTATHSILNNTAVTQAGKLLIAWSGGFDPTAIDLVLDDVTTTELTSAPVTPPPTGQVGGTPAAKNWPHSGGSQADNFEALETFVGFQFPGTQVNSPIDGSVDGVWGVFVDTGSNGWNRSGLPARLHMAYSLALAFGNFVDTTQAASQSTVRTALLATASGANDSTFQQMLNWAKGWGYGAGDFLRLGWELDGSWMPWNAVGNVDAYIAAFRHMYTVALNIFGVANMPVFDANFSAGYFEKFLTTAGLKQLLDGIADIIGVISMDIYDHGLGQPMSGGTWANPAGVWANVHKPRLDKHKALAIQYGKQVAYPEWALSGGGYISPNDHGGDNPTFIQGMYDYQAALPTSGPGSLAYHSYFNDDVLTDGPHSLQSFPVSAALWETLYHP